MRQAEDPAVKNARNRASWMRCKLAADPDYQFRPVLRPAVWDETVLTERWEDRKARVAKERSACALKMGDL